MAEALVADADLRARYLADPAGMLAAYGVGHDDLAALAAAVEARCQGLAPAERRTWHALVFLALAAEHD